MDRDSDCTTEVTSPCCPLFPSGTRREETGTMAAILHLPAKGPVHRPGVPVAARAVPAVHHAFEQGSPCVLQLSQTAAEECAEFAASQHRCVSAGDGKPLGQRENQVGQLVTIPARRPIAASLTSVGNKRGSSAPPRVLDPPPAHDSGCVVAFSRYLET